MIYSDHDELVSLLFKILQYFSEEGRVHLHPQQHLQIASGLHVTVTLDSGWIEVRSELIAQVGGEGHVLGGVCSAEGGDALLGDCLGDNEEGAQVDGSLVFVEGDDG